MTIYCAREFSVDDIQTIRDLIAQDPKLQRSALLRTDLMSTQGLKLFEAEFGAASRSDFGGAHAGQIVGRA